MTATFEDLARRLRDAYAGGTVPPLRDGLDPTDADGAYAVQTINTRFWEAQGRRIVGRKAGLTAKAVQQQLGVDQPDFGVLFDDMRIADGGRLDPARTIQPKAEAEIAFILGADLPDPATTAEQAAAAVARVHTAIEIVDSRIAEWRISLLDTIADNASSGAYVLGGSPRRIDSVDLRLCGMVLEHQGEPLSTGCGAACLGHPLNAVVWLARRMAAAGRPLGPGDIVLSGALGPMVTVQPGASYHARITGAGSVTASFGARA